MPFNRPTLSELRGQTAADIATGLPGADGLLRFSNLKVLGDAVSGLAYMHYGYLDWIAQQAVPYTATDEYMLAWAALKDVFLKQATAATGPVKFNGVTGYSIPPGASVIRGDGETYTVVTGGTIDSSGTVIVTIEDTTPGASGNAIAGTGMALGTAIVGVQSNGAAAAPITGGADQETNDQVRARMLDAYQQPAQGGNASDYRQWAQSAAGVTRAWVAPNGFGGGTVVVYVMFDSANQAEAGFPQGTDGVSQYDRGSNGLPRGTVATGDQLHVADTLLPLQPVTALVYVCSPIASPINFTLSGIPNASIATQAAIAGAVNEVLLEHASPIAGAIVALSDIEASIAAIAGTEGFVITSPAGNLVTTAGQLYTLGAIAYVA